MNAIAEILAVPRPMSIVSRFFLLLAFLVCFALYFEVDIAEALAHKFRAEVQWLDDTYKVENLYVDQDGAHQVFRLVVTQARYIVLDGQVHPPDARGKADASTPIGNAIFPQILLIALAMSWPVKRKLAYIYRLVFIFFACPILWSADVPFELWGLIWTLHVDAFAPDIFSPLLVWNKFMQSGGRIACSAILAILVVHMSNVLAMWSERRDQLSNSLDGS